MAKDRDRKNAAFLIALLGLRGVGRKTVASLLSAERSRILASENPDADLIEILPAGAGRDTLRGIFADLMAAVWKFSDPETGMYWQVPDRPGAAGNYLESSGSAMLAYAMLKGARLGALDGEYADHGQKTFDGIMQKYLTIAENGDLNLGGICLVAGLGPEDNRRRDGSYAYYISEPVVENDAKGVAPFVLCYTEIKRRNG